MTDSRPGHPLSNVVGPARPIHLGRICAVLTLLYLAFVIYGSLVPFDFRPLPLGQVWERFLETPYLSLGVASRSDLVANALLFIPLAFLAMGALSREGTRRSWPWLVPVLMACAALSAGIEFVQLFFPPRTVSLNDILAELIGTVVGLGLWMFRGASVARWARSLFDRHLGRRRAVNLLLGYAVALVLYQLLPLDLTLSPVEVGRKIFREGKLVVIPFSDLKASPGSAEGERSTASGVTAVSDVVSDSAIMVPVGYLMVLVARGRRGGLRRAILWSFLFALGLEGLQLFVYSRYSTSTDVILGTLGGALGAWLATRIGPEAIRPLAESRFWRSWGRVVVALAATMWAAGLAVSLWWPLDMVWPAEGLSAAVRNMIRIPLYRQYWLSEFTAAGNVVRETLTLGVLGMLLAASFAGLGRPGRLAALCLAVGGAVVLEAGQVFVPSRVADGTSMVLMATGAAAGVFLFAGFKRLYVDTPADARAGHPG